MHLAPRKHTLAEDSGLPFYTGRKLGDVEQALVWRWLHDDPECPSRVLLDKGAETRTPLAVSVRQLHRLRVLWQLNRPKGRPRRAEGRPPVGSGGALVEVTPRLWCVGVPLLAHWLDQQETFGPVVARLPQAIEAHKRAYPDDDFALLYHREQTLLRRFPALFLAPWVGVDRLTAFDTHEHPLQPLLRRGSHSSTRRQFLGHLERINASEALMPTLLPAKAGQMTYVDGHMIASGSRVPLHKGKITMRGRIMAGSHAVLAHDETGQALFVAYYPPDIHVSQVMVAYGQKVRAATGSALFGSDRAVNAVAMARAVNDQGLGLLCMLDDNAYQGLDSFEAPQVDTLADGTRVYSGPWKVSRPDDPRRFVMVEPPAGTTLVYWATPHVEAVLEVTAWPRVYRARNDMQEQRLKRMIDHGARAINYGRKRLVGPDRQQQRARAKLEQALEASQKRVAKKTEARKAKQDQAAESELKGHGTRLAQRQHALAVWDKELAEAHHNQDHLAEQVQAFGPTRERADRDCRKQTIMTVRTLWLENALRACMIALVGLLQTKVSWEMIWHLLFERSGARMETNSQVVYWVNTAGLSVPYRRVLTEIVNGLCALDVRDQGKPICVRLKDMSP